MIRLPEPMPKNTKSKMPPVQSAEIRPQPGPQTAFLTSPADIVIYGGSAGGGKTFALLMEPLRHIDNRKFGAVIFRRTYPEIMNEGAMWDESQGIYPMVGASSNKQELSWTFPSGARVTFGHIQYDADLSKWTGSQIALIEFDQLETFTERQFFYMLSRNRSASGVRPYVRATCNPDPESFLARFLDWWIAEDGYADLDRVGKVRWFVRRSEKTEWADSRAELVEKYPKTRPLSVTYIPASLYDNQILMEKDPDYEAKLMALDPIEQARLLGDRRRGGNWKVKPAAGKVFNRGWFKIVDAAPSVGFDVRNWDFAATEKQLDKDDPDFTASVKIRHTPGLGVYILDCTADQINGAEVESNFLNMSRNEARFGKLSGIPYRARWEGEPGSAGKREAQRLTGLLKGVDAKGIPASGQGDKLTRAKPLAAQAYAGNVYLVAGPWNEMFLEHMHHQPEWPHDDIMDAASGAYNAGVNELGEKQKSGKSKVTRSEEVFG